MYVNEMEDYLYNHNYISENNNNIKQQELSIERASCIVQKHRTLIEEKDKEIEQLKEELKLANESITWWSNRYKAIEHLYRYTPEKGFELVGDEDVEDKR